MAKSMADKQFNAAQKAAGKYIEEELFFYYTSTDQWTRVANFSFEIDTQFFVDFYAKKGFEIARQTEIDFCVRKTSLVKAGA